MKLGHAIFLVLVIGASVCSSGEGRTNSTQSNPAINPSDVFVTYIGNAGVLLSTSSQQVLIDGLHREYKPHYASPPDGLLKSIESGKPPYQNIRLVLITHLHLDHFHPLSVGSILQNNPRAELVSSDQIAEGVKREFSAFAEVQDQVKRVPHRWKEKVALNAAGISLRCLGLRHSSSHFSWIQNLGYVVELNGKKFLHVGDADVTTENFSSLGLVDERIDVAFVPYWFLLSETGRALVEKHIRAKQVVAVHVQPTEAAKIAEQLRVAYPQAITFMRILETRIF